MLSLDELRDFEVEVEGIWRNLLHQVPTDEESLRVPNPLRDQLPPSWWMDSEYAELIMATSQLSRAALRLRVLLEHIEQEAPWLAPLWLSAQENSSPRT